MGLTKSIRLQPEPLSAPDRTDKEIGTAFDPRTTFWLSVIAACGLTPFALLHLVKSDLFMAAIVSSLDLVAIAIAIEIRRNGSAAPKSLLAAIIIGNVVVLLTTTQLQLIGVFWVYPVLVFNYSVVGTRAANWINLCLCLAVFSYAATWTSDAQMLRIVATTILTAVFAYIFSSNIDRQKQALRELASVDPLTGARNRREMQLGLKRACETHERHGTPSVLFIIDLDFFKQINDQYGHDVGDEVLVEVVNLVGKRLRVTDLLYRYGGEEFLVLANGTPTEQGLVLAEDLRERVQNGCKGDLPPVRISIGVAELAANESPAEWLKRADDALYRAKANGRNRVEIAECSSPTPVT